MVNSKIRLSKGAASFCLGKPCLVLYAILGTLFILHLKRKSPPTVESLFTYVMSKT